MLKLSLSLGYLCSRCGEHFNSVILDERRVHVALFGMTDQVCPICYSTPLDRDGEPLPPPPPPPEAGEEKGDEI